MTEPEAFFTFQESLPRQGPGDRASLQAALMVVGVGRDQRICDAGCGTGADIAGLLDWAPEGHVTAIDTHASFIDKARARHAGDARVTARVQDMHDLTGPFDLIWCAGALYFMGLPDGLAVFRAALAPGGALIFSHPAFFTDTPSDAARAFWDGEDASVMNEADLCDAVRVAGYDIHLATRLPVNAWEAYYTPMEQRVSEWRASAGPAMTKVLDAAQAEIDQWRAVRGETGYLQFVAYPK
ncbi:MAG: methyltransferase domain-containing protein [Rhodobacteraceae bacterium]|nr:methyltransferase domain-containing protein [Paracoccaceae bacterium]